MKQDFLKLKSLVKVFGSGDNAVKAVDDIDLTVNEGELVTLLGPSGCGKTTTLRIISGFQIPTSGEILIDDEVMNNIPPNKRPTTMVFQNYALFPHLTVFENIAYGLKIGRTPRADVKERVEKVMELVDLSGLTDRSPTQLSGGQQQRVSLARSLVMEPKVLLLDEPLSNLDAKLRVSTRLEIRMLQKRVGITSIYVTHDQEEAMTLSDRVVIMHEGKIQQVSSPVDIYAHPDNRFVAGFIGKANFLEGKILAAAAKGKYRIHLLGREITLDGKGRKFSDGEKVLIVARPEAVEVSTQKENTVKGTIINSVYLGSEIIYRVESGGFKMDVRIADPQDHLIFNVGENVSVAFNEKSLHILPWEESSE